MSRDQLKQLKDRETENARPGRSASDLTLDKIILTESIQGNIYPPSTPP